MTVMIDPRCGRIGLHNDIDFKNWSTAALEFIDRVFNDSMHDENADVEDRIKAAEIGLKTYEALKHRRLAFRFRVMGREDEIPFEFRL